MKVKVLKRTGKELRFEIEGEGHTLCNLLEKVILEDENVDVAGYRQSHPLTSNPVIYIRTKGRRRPETVLKETAKKILQNCEEFQTEFNKALDNWEKKRE